MPDAPAVPLSLLPAVVPAAAEPPPPKPQRYRLTIAYDGTLFHGWQKQSRRGEPGVRTVAGVVEEAIVETLGQPVNLVGASRTDAGVHARGQTAQFDAVTRIPVERLAEAINSRLPADVDILSVRCAAPDFDCIKHPVSKQYRYRLFNWTHRPLSLRYYTWHCWWRLDVDRMNDAARRLEGTHDFAGFASAHHGRESTIRTIHRCYAERRPLEIPAPEDLGQPPADPGVPWATPEVTQDAAGLPSLTLPAQTPSEVHLVVQGSGFLYNMVRIIAGTLVEIGRGHLPPETIDQMLETGKRQLGGPTLPAQGLWLEWIRYPAEGTRREARRHLGT